MSLYNKYRPRSLRRVIGHEQVVTTLRGKISEGKLGSAILFTGPTSVGKTTLAKALAADILGTKTILASNPNFSEYNLSENRTIEDIRAIISVSKLKPRDGAIKRIILLEEFQGILGAPAAGNAFLSALENPPDSTLFILCSMEGDKFGSGQLGKALANRCLRFNLQPPGKAELVKQAKRIVTNEGASYITDEVISEVADNCSSQMRILANTLEGLIGYYDGLAEKPEELSKDDVLKVLESSSNDEAAVVNFIIALLSGKFTDAQLALLDVGDATGFAMKTCSVANFVLNNILLKCQRHPKVWGTTTGWNAFKRLKEVKSSAGLKDSDLLDRLAELNSALVSFKLQAGAFAVDERLALSAVAWNFVKQYRNK